MKRKLICLGMIIALMCALCSGGSASAITDDALFGTIDGSSYENTVIGLSCLLDGWRYYSKAELRRTSSEIMVMCAVSPNGYSNINVQARDLRPYTSAPSTDEDVEAYVDYMLENGAAIYQGYGFRDVRLTKGTVEISGKTLPCIYTGYVYLNQQIYQKALAYLLNQYMVYVTVTGTSFDEADEIMSCITVRWE